MAKAVCPGSFDPPTVGHADIVGRAAAIFDEVTVAVLVNERKAGLFAEDERVAMLRDMFADVGNVGVEAFSGLLVTFCTDRGISTIVKGLRSGNDFDYELQMAQMNARLAGIETVFLATSPGLSFVASSLVKEVAGFGGDVSDLVPPQVASRLAERVGTSGASRDVDGQARS